MRVGEIKVQGRATQGIRLMRVDDGEHVAAIERLAEPGETSGIAEAAPIEAVEDGDTVPNEGLEDEVGDEDARTTRPRRHRRRRRVAGGLTVRPATATRVRRGRT